jgi:dTDP-4-dehydrorhamnose 3,5-epimerase
MKVLPTRIPGVVVLEPRVFPDERGFFLETWSRERYADAGIAPTFVQDNLSFSRRHVLRGMHFQNPAPQGKLVSVLDGAVYDVAVDLRRSSPTFGEWVGVELSSENHRQMYVPEGFAHGFVVTSDTALFSYKCTRAYSPHEERSLRWDDPDVGIEWPVSTPVLSAKDAGAPRLRDIPEEFLFLTVLAEGRS